MEDGSSAFRPANAEGMVYIMFGSNYTLGGKNTVKGDASYWFPITNATVKIDGKTVIRDGILTLD